MSLQTIIDTAQKIQFDRRKVVGQTVSRSQRVKAAKRNSANPLALTVTPSAYFNYANNRSLVEGIVLNDRYQEFQIKLANNTKMAYLNQYQGNVPTFVNATTITNFVNNIVTMRPPVLQATQYLFRAGDWIQPFWSRYPYIITEDVPFNNTYTVTATVHRNLITSEATTVTGAMLIGTDTTMRVIITDLPTYEVGLYKQLSWSGDFTLVEKII